MTGFLSKAAHGEGSGGALALLPGSLVEAVVTQASDRRMIAVTTDSTAVSVNLTKEWDGLDIGEFHNQSANPMVLIAVFDLLSLSCEHAAISLCG